MIDPDNGGILRFPWFLANSATVALSLLAMAVGLSTASSACGQTVTADSSSELTSFAWDFSRADDPHFKKFPAGWKRVRDVGYPNYVISEITARDPDREKSLVSLDTQILRWWTLLRRSMPTLPQLPPSIADSLTDRYLRIELDGGQFAAQSPEIPASRRYQYQFSCQIATRGLRYDSALAEFVFVGDDGKLIQTHATEPVSGTTDWIALRIPPVQPPPGATKMFVRLKVLRSDDGLEDIRGSIGFDNIRIDRLPHLAVTTDQPLGLYHSGQTITASAKILGLPKGTSSIQFSLIDSAGNTIGGISRSVEIGSSDDDQSETAGAESDSGGTDVSWRLPSLDPGFYRITAAIDGRHLATLASETTLVVIDRLMSGPPHGCFGWTLPQGAEGLSPREIAPWLADCGVAWVKYPCWLAPDDVAGAEEIAAIFSRIQDQGIETIGMLDSPPESQQPLYELRGRRDLVAAQLFRNQTTWEPLLEPIMTRMTLRIRRWQLGADRDHSFLGRPRLNESISQISTGLQGYGQPIDIAISWPWEESQFQDGKSAWQAECRSSDPPLNAHELDAYLSNLSLDSRPESPSTWLLTDPISSTRYDQATRIQDLLLRMATVRSHRVQASFISDPRDPERGLLRKDGRPGELLLPWRTTSRLIGNLRKAGSLQLRHGSQNIVFFGDNRAVLMLWSQAAKEERLYLGDDVKMVDVWGNVTDLPLEFDGDQPAQVIRTGPVPIFIVGADASLLAFRMSVAIEPVRLDSLIGLDQRLSVSLTNTSDQSLIGEMRIRSPESWSIESANRSWGALAGRSVTESFNVALTNTAMIGQYEVPIQFDLDTVPPKRITVFRQVTVGPDGIDVDIRTRLLDQDELKVEIELTNRTSKTKAFVCLMFPPPGRQFQERVIVVEPGTTVRRNFFWSDASDFLGQQMTLRAVEQNGPRVINYGFKVRG